MNKAFFFDRDGILNKGIYRYDEEHQKYLDAAPTSLKEFKINESAKKIIQHVKSKGFIPIIVTNQPDFLKRNLLLKDYEEITSKLCKEFGLERGQVFECFHKKGFSLECSCKKPKPGLFLMAKGVYEIDMKISWVIGDSHHDIEAANKAGVLNSIFLRIPKIKGKTEGNEESEKKLLEKGIKVTHIIKNISEVADLI